MTDFIDRTVVILGKPYEVRLHPQVTCAELIDNITDEFESELDAENRNPPFYLWIENGSAAMRTDAFVATIGMGQNLVFGTESELPENETFRVTREKLQQVRSEKLNIPLRIYFEQRETGIEYHLEWRFVIFGREGDIDFDTIAHLPIHKTDYAGTDIPVSHISRDHAAVFIRRQEVYIASLRADNPVIVNGDAIPFEVATLLQSGDEVQLGNKAFVLTFHRPQL